MSFHDLSASTLKDATGKSEVINFAAFKGKIVLIENVASL